MNPLHIRKDAVLHLENAAPKNSGSRGVFNLARDRAGVTTDASFKVKDHAISHGSSPSSFLYTLTLAAVSMEPPIIPE